MQGHGCVVYWSLCSFEADYIAETNRNSKIRRKKHNTGKDKNSDCAKHLNDNFNHEF